MGIVFDPTRLKNAFELLQKQLKAPEDEATKKASELMKQYVENASKYDQVLETFSKKIIEDVTNSIGSLKWMLIGVSCITGGTVGSLYYDADATRTKQRLSYAVAAIGILILLASPSKWGIKKGCELVKMGWNAVIS